MNEPHWNPGGQTAALPPDDADLAPYRPGSVALGSDATTSPGQVEIDPSRRLVLTSVAVVSALAAGVAGTLVGYFVAVEFGLNSTDGWESLGGFIMGLLAGLIAGSVAYVVSVLSTVAVTMPKGLRFGPAVVLIGCPVAAVAALLALGTLGVASSTSTIAGLAWLLTYVAALASSVVLLWVAGRAAPTEWLVNSAKVTGALAIVSVLLSLSLG